MSVIRPRETCQKVHEIADKLLAQRLESNKARILENATPIELQPNQDNLISNVKIPRRESNVFTLGYNETGRIKHVIKYLDCRI